MTLLHIGGHKGKYQSVKRSLDLGANINLKNCFGNTPLYIAVAYDHLHIVKLLLDHNADTERKNRFGFTPLHISSICGHVNIVKLLLDYGADIEGKDNYSRTALHHSSYFRHIDVMKLLLNSGANIGTKNNKSETPLQSLREKQVYSVTLPSREHNIACDLLERYENIIQLKEWRPWNHSKYNSNYRNTIKTFVLLAKVIEQ